MYFRSLLIALCLCSTTIVSAATTTLPKWHISVNRLEVSPGNLATDMIVSNDDRIIERFEVTAYSWTQKNNVDQRTPDINDVLVFPRVMILNPGESKTIRVGVLHSDPTVEGDYRIAIQQLFDPQKGQPGLHFLLAYNLPLFITPVHSVSNARITDIRARNKTVYVTVRNDGNIHVLANALTIVWQGHTTKRAGLDYVLPGATMTFLVPVRECGSGNATVTANPESHIAPLTAPLIVPCR